MPIFNRKIFLVQMVSFLTVASITVQTKGACAIPTSNPKCTASVFSTVLPTPNITVVSVTFNEANSSYQDPTDIPYGQRITSELPAYCSVLCHVVTSSTSSFLFLVWLPDTTWNHRFLMVGNGGLGGGLNYPDCGAGMRRGFACATTNTGHNSSLSDGSWAYNNPETVSDWGYRAMHESVVLSKRIVHAYYPPQEQLRASYYQGCSTGGRQGLKEIQDFPNDFNGALIGAPAWWNTHQEPWNVKIGTHFLPNTSSRYIRPELFPVIHAEILRQCDCQDGLCDQTIGDPSRCAVNLNLLLCSTMNKKTSNCLKPDQLDALSRLYSDYVETNQTYVFTHMPFGSELQWTALISGNQPNGMGLDYIRYFVLNESQWEYTNFDYSIIQKADQLRPGNAIADNFDLRPFFSQGAKLIHYHGLADGLIPPGSSQYYYDRVYRNFLDTDLNQYYRFFHIPGMGHCDSGVYAPWIIGGQGQDSSLGSQYFGVAGFNDSQHDALLALVEWVENGIAPEKIIATKYINDDPAQGVQRQRPICPYPKKARYLGAGSIDDPNNFHCSN